MVSMFVEICHIAKTKERAGIIVVIEIYPLAITEFRKDRGRKSGVIFFIEI